MLLSSFLDATMQITISAPENSPKPRTSQSRLCIGLGLSNVNCRSPSGARVRGL